MHVLGLVKKSGKLALLIKKYKMPLVLVFTRMEFDLY